MAPKNQDYLDSPKKLVVYAGQDPYSFGVTHLAIQTETNPPYVWNTYGLAEVDVQENIKALPKDMLFISLENAKRLFDLKKVKSLAATRPILEDRLSGK